MIFSHIFLYSQFSMKLEDSYRDIRGDDEREEEDEKGEDEEEGDEEEGNEEEGNESSDDNDERVWREVGLIPKIHINYSYQH